MENVMGFYNYHQLWKDQKDCKTCKASLAHINAIKDCKVVGFLMIMEINHREEGVHNHNCEILHSKLQLTTTHTLPS